MAETDPITPDTKDWTWVLRAGRAPSAASTPARSPLDGGRRARSATTPPLGSAVLRRTRRRRPPGARRLVAAGVRLPRPRRAPALRRAARLMLDQDGPRSRTGTRTRPRSPTRYGEQDPARSPPSWSRPPARSPAGTTASRPARGQRTGRRSDGASSPSTRRPLPPARRRAPRPRRRARVARRATVAPTTLTPTSTPTARPRRRTSAPTRRGTSPRASGPVRRVLEIGTGGGRDAVRWRGRPRVRRTDITPGFVALLQERGHEADLIDPLTDDLGTPEGPLRRRVGERLPAARGPAPTSRRCCPARGRHPARRGARARP